ncbi:MAG: hypothetical protein ACRD0P_23280, partial [Stackebrandtia sp.]
MAPPPLATPFAPIPWRATAELLLPDTFSFSHAFNVIKRDPEAEYPDFDLLHEKPTSDIQVSACVFPWLPCAGSR